MDEVTITGDEAVLASRIKTIDRDVADLDRQVDESVEWGIRGGGAIAQAGQESAAKRRASMLTERADLVAQMKREVAES